MCAILLLGNFPTSYQFTFTVADSAPAFSSSFANQEVQLCSNLTYLFPVATDLNNNPLTYSTYDSSTNLQPTYVSFASSTILLFAPTISTLLGTHTFIVTANDSLLSTSAAFILNVTNTAPYFTSSLVQQTVYVGVTAQYTLPLVIDPNSCCQIVTMSVTSPITGLQPFYLAFTDPTNTTLVFSNTTPIGTHVLSLNLSDGVATTTYSLILQIINAAAPNF